MTNGDQGLAGRRVGEEEVIAVLGRPSANWERNSRMLQFCKRLRHGETVLGIAGIRGYGGREGYLGYLERSLKSPLGVGTGLVSAEEDARIRTELESETREYIAKHRRRLSDLHRSSEALEEYVDTLERWLKYVESDAPSDPANEPDEELQTMAREQALEHQRELGILKTELSLYTAYLEAQKEGRAVDRPEAASFVLIARQLTSSGTAWQTYINALARFEPPYVFEKDPVELFTHILKYSKCREEYASCEFPSEEAVSTEGLDLDSVFRMVLQVAFEYVLRLAPLELEAFKDNEEAQRALLLLARKIREGHCPVYGF